MTKDRTSPLFAEGNVAVITGAASGIGRAAAQRFASIGMKVVLFDRNEAVASVAAELNDAKYLVGDVSRIEDLQKLRDLAMNEFGKVTILMNNAAIGGQKDDNWTGLDGWRRTIDVNLWGVVNGVHAFSKPMLSQGSRGAIVNTGSKQGITNPPGSPAYAVSKAGVRTLTEQLAHGLREEGGNVTAHLLVPGWTFTGLTDAPGGVRPKETWTAEQVIDLMMGRVEKGEFYVICPDDAVSPELDAARILWGASDLTENRPALSRWHPDWKEQFEGYIAKEVAQ
jgi:NAD(P)-dependent dehydrogenase (short-subunit alcohol dehydrogenase family)